MARMRVLIFPLAVCFISVLFGCCNRISSPTSPTPGKSSYKWQIDTITYPGSPQTVMQSIWASSPSNVFVVGHNAGGDGKMFHFDGTKWSSIDLNPARGGSIPGAIDLGEMIGFASNDIYAVGEHIWDNPTRTPSITYTSLLIHFDGSTWKEVAIPQMNLLEHIWGSSPTDLWLGGMWGTLMHFDGSQWAIVPVDSNTQFLSIFGFSSAEVYTVAWRSINHVDFASAVQSFSRLSLSGMATIDSFQTNVPCQFGYRLWGSTDNRLCSAGPGMFRRGIVGWTELAYPPGSVNTLGGTRPEHLFAAGQQNQIYHFDGTNWQHYSELDNPALSAWAVWCDENEVFVLSSDGFRSFVYHGK